MSNGPDSSRKVLGKGLAALLPARHPTPVTAASSPEINRFELPIDSLDPNPLQPRNVFQPDRLAELAQSIRENGIIQPLVVRLHGGRHQLVAGERRWRAAKIAGLATVPVVVRDFADNRLLEVTLVENIQREDLNPIELAQAFERLGKDLGLSHEQIAQRTGKDRTTITNMIRLLHLPADIQILLAERRLSMGHARAILGLEQQELQIQVAQKASAEGMSVRQVERLVQKMTTSREPKSSEQVKQDPNVRAAAEALERVLGTRVRIVEKSDNRGRIEIEYYSPDELIHIYEKIVGESEE
jgi:ParB family transcriptional regulator, chromosome partitioning protein